MENSISVVFSLFGIVVFNLFFFGSSVMSVSLASDGRLETGKKSTYSDLVSIRSLLLTTILSLRIRSVVWAKMQFCVFVITTPYFTTLRITYHVKLVIHFLGITQNPYFSIFYFLYFRLTIMSFLRQLSKNYTVLTSLTTLVKELSARLYQEYQTRPGASYVRLTLPNLKRLSLSHVLYSIPGSTLFSRKKSSPNS